MNFERTQTSSQGFTGDSGVKNLPANAGEPEDLGSIPEMGGNSNPLRYSCLENSMNRGA